MNRFRCVIRLLALVFAIPLWLTATYATARTVYHTSANRRARELEGLTNRLAALAQELVPTPERSGKRKRNE